MSPRCATVSQACLAVVWVVRVERRYPSPRGLLLVLRGNYTELIKKMSQMKSIKVMFHM